MIDYIICYNCFDFWFLLWVIFVVALYYFGLHFLGDKEATGQTNDLEKTARRLMDEPDEILIDRVMKAEWVKIDEELKEKEGIENWIPVVPEVYILEMCRRLIIQFKNFNRITALFSGALIMLAIVQVILLLVQLMRR
jgi:hypothetical protein